MAISTGTKVKIIIDPPAGTPVEGVVIVSQKTPGKSLGVELLNFADYAHSLDKRVAEKIDQTRGITVGKGWWTTEENVEVLEE